VCAQQESRSMQLLLATAPTKTKNQKPKTTLEKREWDNVENIIVVLVVDLNCFRSNAQKRLTKDCSDQMCTSWC
jgi:hypothetical protein